MSRIEALKLLALDIILLSICHEERGVVYIAYRDGADPSPNDIKWCSVSAHQRRGFLGMDKAWQYRLTGYDQSRVAIVGLVDYSRKDHPGGAIEYVECTFQELVV